MRNAYKENLIKMFCLTFIIYFLKLPSHFFPLSSLYLWKESHAYNKGKTLVVSKVPLPDYRADLDEHHGSTQKEVIFISMLKLSLSI